MMIARGRSPPGRHLGDDEPAADQASTGPATGVAICFTRTLVISSVITLPGAGGRRTFVGDSIVEGCLPRWDTPFSSRAIRPETSPGRAAARCARARLRPAAHSDLPAVDTPRRRGRRNVTDSAARASIDSATGRHKDTARAISFTVGRKDSTTTPPV